MTAVGYFVFVSVCYCNFSLLLFIRQELLTSVGSVEFSGGKAEITEVSNCVGDVSSSSM